MKYENKTLDRIKFCLGHRFNNDWITVRSGDSIDLIEVHKDIALAHGLTLCEECEVEVKAEESSIGEVRVETKKRGRPKKVPGVTITDITNAEVIMVKPIEEND